MIEWKESCVYYRAKKVVYWIGNILTAESQSKEEISVHNKTVVQAISQQFSRDSNNILLQQDVAVHVSILVSIECSAQCTG